MTETKKKKPVKKTAAKKPSEPKIEKTTSPEVKKKTFLINNGKVLVITAVVILLAFLGTVGALIYTNDESVFVKRVAQILPYPAAFVEINYVSAYSYLDQLDILKNYYREFENTDFNSEEGKSLHGELRKEVMERLVEDRIIATEAKKMDISVSEEDMNKEFDQLVASNGGQEEFTNILNKYYGLTIDEFKKKIYKPRMLRQKLTEAINADEEVDAAAKAQANEVHQKAIADGADFAALAKEYSQDPGSAANGGDLGFFKKGTMVPEFENVAFKLKKGGISEPLKTVYGYHIITVTDTKGDEIKASHILIPVRDFNKWLEEKKAELNEKSGIAGIWKLIPTN